MVVRKEGPSPEILRTEKETEVHLKLADTTPDFQGTEPLLSKIIPTDQSSLSNSLGPIPNYVERKFDELFEERLQEIDCDINKFDTNKESVMDRNGNGSGSGRVFSYPGLTRGSGPKTRTRPD